MKWFWMLPMTAAIACALFSEKIDESVKGDYKFKKVIVVFSVGTFFISTIGLIACIL